MNFFHLSPEINVVLALKMDLEKIKRFANSEFESWKIAKAVTEVKNEIKDAEQGRDVVMSDVFKTLRDPLIEQQKKTDAKQDAVIEQLRQNQLALTGGIQDIVTLNRELPQLPAESDEASKEKLTLVPNNLFSAEDLSFIKSIGLPEPNALLGLSGEYLAEITHVTKKERKKISDKITGVKNKKGLTPTQKDEEVKQLEKQRDRERPIFDNYLTTITMVQAIPKYTKKKGSGIRKYKQPKRNAYKISDSSFGNLSVDVPKLKNEMKLNVFRGGKIVYNADADKSLVDLLTKRFNPKRSYSLNAVKIFNDLNLLANLPKHPSSGKSKLLGSGVVYYNDPNKCPEKQLELVSKFLRSLFYGNHPPSMAHGRGRESEQAAAEESREKDFCWEKTAHSTKSPSWEQFFKTKMERYPPV